MKYIFKTTATMKPYNRKNWWIDTDIVTEKTITANNIKEALRIYQKEVEENHYIFISKNALKNKNPMYADTTKGETKQVGYVITEQCDFETNDYKWSKQYIDLWIEILTVSETVF